MKLRWIAPLICCVLPLQVWAFFCPTNSKFIEDGMPAEDVERVCGKPTKVTKLDNSTIISAIWTYKVEFDGLNKTAKFTFDNGHIISMTQSVACPLDAMDCIPTIDENIAIFYGCEQIMYLGNNIPFVEKYCGTPDEKQTLKADYDITELYYYAGTTEPSTLVLHNGILEDSQ